MNRPIRRILLVKPPYTILRNYPKLTEPPLGLGYIAAVLRRDYDVRILDAQVEGFKFEEKIENGRIRFGLPFHKIDKIIEDWAPDIVGVSCLFSTQITNSLTLLKHCKDISKDIITMIGGAHSSALPGEIAARPEVDYVIIGEGEYTSRDLIRALERGKSVREIDGIAYKENSRVFVNPKTLYIDNIDELPFPARSLMPMEKYFRINLPQGGVTRRPPVTNITTSRGCPRQCTFCATTVFWGKKYRVRSPQHVLQEIDQLVEKYCIRELHFQDDNLTCIRSRAIEIFKGLVERKYDLVWTTPNGIETMTLDEELIALMKESGCYELCLPVESGNDYVLRNILKKPLNLKKVEKVIQSLKKHKITVSGSFVVGFPGENKKQIQDTFNFVWEHDFDNVDFNIATPFPGTELYNICKEKGYLPKDISFDKLDFLEAHISTPEFTREEILSMVARNTFWHRATLILRNPAEFFRRYVLFSLKNPQFFFRYVTTIILQALFRS